MFHRDWGMRIDLVLANDALTSAVRGAYIDRDSSKGPRPSDHAPVIVDLDLHGRWRTRLCDAVARTEGLEALWAAFNLGTRRCSAIAVDGARKTQR